MKNIALIPLSIFCFAFFRPALAGEAAESKLKLTPAEVNVGEIHVGDYKDNPVNVENPTDKPITVTNVRGSCGCVTPTMAVTTVAPGKTEVLNVKYHGLFNKKKDTVYVFLTTNEADSPQAKLPVHTNVTQEFALDPETVRFDLPKEPLKKGDTKTVVCVMKSVDGKPFEIKQLAPYNKEFTVAWEPVEGSNKSAYKISTTVKAVKGGPLNESVRILTDRPDPVGTALLYLNATVSSDAVCTPDIINAETDDKGGVAPFQTLTVKRVTPGKLEITSVTETRQAALDFTVTPVAGDDSSVQLSIKLKDPAAKQYALGQFLVKTNADEGPIHVPYRINLPKGVGMGHY